jgi:hypothetical protein
MSSSVDPPPTEESKPLKEVIGLTVNVAFTPADCAPLDVVATAVKVVVWLGDGMLTLAPLAPTRPGLAPTLALITTYAAFVEFQLSVTPPPTRIVPGFTVKEVTMGACATVTVADALVLPPAPVAV